jgi:hypothetical protein
MGLRSENSFGKTPGEPWSEVNLEIQDRWNRLEI